MTQQECIDLAVRRVVHNRVFPFGTRELLLTYAREALDPLTKRDQTMVDGRVLQEKYDPETRTTDTVEVQLHPSRLVASYRYQPADVLWLEREIRRMAGL